MYELILYIPLHIVIFVFTYKIVEKYKILEKIPKLEIAQHITSLVHTYVVVMGCILHNYNNVYNTRNIVIPFSIAYFINDSIYIILLNRTQLYFIVHHFMALWMCYMQYIDKTNIKNMSMMFIYIEISNIFLIKWGLFRKNKSNYLEYYNKLKPYTIATYVPYRTLGLTYIILKELIESHDKKSIIVPLLSLWLMSVYYSYKLLKINNYKLDFIKYIHIYIIIELFINYIPNYYIKT
jgi:hypothetical protein